MYLMYKRDWLHPVGIVHMRRSVCIGLVAVVTVCTRLGLPTRCTKFPLLRSGCQSIGRLRAAQVKVLGGSRALLPLEPEKDV